MRLTNWFPAEINPVHVGVYLIDRGSQGKWFRHWNGSYWSLCGENVNEADEKKMVKSPAPAFPWRGIFR
jgi:hypothetical protein